MRLFGGTLRFIALHVNGIIIRWWGMYVHNMEHNCYVGFEVLTTVIMNSAYLLV
jgi:hypothetical protein